MSRLAALLLAAALACPIANADAATTPTPVPAAPAQCTATPRTPAEIAALLATPIAATPDPAPSPVTLVPADPATEQAAIDLVGAFFGCLNAGDKLAAWGLVTDDYLRQVASPNPGIVPDGSPVPREPEDQTVVLAVEAVRVDGEGRVWATVRLDPALIPVEKQFRFTLVRTDEGWRISDVLNELEFSLG